MCRFEKINIFIFSFARPVFIFSLGPVYAFVCISFRTGNLNCFSVK